MDQKVTAEKSRLLKELTIERGATKPGNARRMSAVAVCCALLAAIATGAFWAEGRTKDGEAIGAASAGLDSEAAVLPPISTAPEASSEASIVGLSEPSVLDATGYVVARLAATVSAKTTGKVAQVKIEEGMAVAKGQVMAILDDTSETARLELSIAELQATKTRRRELGAQIKRTQLDHTRAHSLVEKQLVSQSHLDALRADLQTLLAREQSAAQAVVVSERRVAVHRVALADLTIRAPFDGIVISKSAQPGEMISPVTAGGGFTRTGIGTVVDMNSLEVQVDVSEAYIERVYHGQSVEIKLNAYPEHVYAGLVLAVIPTADRNKATIRVRIQFVATDARVLPEMGVRVAFLAV